MSGDFFETLLYKIFVTINEKLTIEELAALLQTDIEMVKVANFPITLESENIDHQEKANEYTQRHRK